MAKTDPKEQTPPPADIKRQAFTAAADAVATIEKRADQVDVLRAVAAFFGLKVQFENGEIR